MILNKKLFIFLKKKVMIFVFSEQTYVEKVYLVQSTKHESPLWTYSFVNVQFSLVQFSCINFFHYFFILHIFWV